MQPFLNRCAEVEETLAQIYTELAVTVAAEQTLKNIWLAMADDEGEHAREIRMAVRMLKEDIVVGEQVPDAEIRQLLAQARDLLAKVRQSDLGVKEALSLSLHLESDFRRVHVLCAVRFADEGLRRVFELLGRADQEHVARLSDYCRKFAALEKGGSGDAATA
jgi:rubrerythrin